MSSLIAGGNTVTPTNMPQIKQRNLRNVELFLLICAGIVGFAMLAAVQLGYHGYIQQGPFVWGIAIGVMALVFHIVLRFTAPKADPILLPVTLMLNVIGIVFIYRLDLAFTDAQRSNQIIGGSQLVYTFIAMVLAIAALLLIRNHRWLQRYTYIVGLVAIAFLVLPKVPGIGTDHGTGTWLWVRIGGFTFQPGEVVKILLAIFFAGYLARHRESLAIVGHKFLWMQWPRGRDLGPLIIVWLISVGILVLLHDLGTSLLYFGLFLVMLYVATGRSSWIIIGLTLFIGGAYVASQKLSYVHFRFQAWLDPFPNKIYNAQGGSYQLVQGMFGQAAGGLTGTGLGQGRPSITPLASSDFIYAALAEELGLVGVFAILCLYLIFISRGLRTAFAAQDDFGKLLASGLSFVIALQCFIVIGGVTRVIPMTGVTAPFLAAGGSSLLTNWIIVAILLRLSDAVGHQPRQLVTPHD